MRVVVDASVAVKWLVAESEEEAATNLIERNDELHAPRLLVSEVANTLRRKAENGDIAPVDAQAASAAISLLPLNWADDELDAQLAHRIALELDCPVYNCVYLAMAIRIGGVMVTADKQFANLNQTTLNARFVKTLREYAESMH